jgi:hypothetical protein
MRSAEILARDNVPADSPVTPASGFVIQVLYKPTGEVVQWAPGRSVEKAIVDELCERVAKKGVGVGRTTAHVVLDVRAALNELLLDLKKQV